MPPSASGWFTYDIIIISIKLHRMYPTHTSKAAIRRLKSSPLGYYIFKDSPSSTVDPQKRVILFRL